MSNTLIPIQIIENRIFIIRGQKVMIDSDLAQLYEVETRNLNKAVKRNISRFPDDFMFQLTNEEWNNLKFQFGTSSWGGRRKLPYAFTEHGVLMLSSALNSEKAAQVNIQIMRAFVKLRQLTNQPTQEIAELRKLLMLYIEKNDDRVDEIIRVLNNLLEYPRHPEKIGFRTEE